MKNLLYSPMDFPEIPFGDKRKLGHSLKIIADQMKRGPKRLVAHTEEIAREIFETYLILDPLIEEGVGPTCAHCISPCCVNRHFFPDFEDLIFYSFSGTGPPPLDFDARELDICIFLGRKGCTLPRPQRSYRCTWYFCDFSLDEFKKRDIVAYAAFETALNTLMEKRLRLLKSFQQLAH